MRPNFGLKRKLDVEQRTITRNEKEERLEHWEEKAQERNKEKAQEILLVFSKRCKN